MLLLAALWVARAQGSGGFAGTTDVST